jgi:hypothetical protein
MEEPVKVPLIKQLLILMKIGYTELQYWLVGMMPESYHFRQSRHYDELGALERSVHHAREVLRDAEEPEPRARLGAYCMMRGKLVEAVEHYRKAVETWPHPSLLLALAQAELRVGRHGVAADLLVRVESSEMRDQFLEGIAEVRCQLAAASSELQGDTSDAARAMYVAATNELPK